MTPFKAGEPRAPQTEGFKPFEFQKLEAVEAKTNRGEDKRDFLRGTCSDKKLRIMMADELMHINNSIEDKYMPIVKADNPKVKSDPKLRELLAEKVGHLAPLVTTDGLIGRPEEMVVYNNPEISREDEGLRVE